MQEQQAQGARDLNKQQQKDVLVLLATFKSFNEQLYNLKGVNSQEIKMWFNRLIKTAKSYEDALTKKVNFGENDLELIYDSITDIIYYLREGYEKDSATLEEQAK